MSRFVGNIPEVSIFRWLPPPPPLPPPPLLLLLLHLPILVLQLRHGLTAPSPLDLSPNPCKKRGKRKWKRKRKRKKRRNAGARHSQSITIPSHMIGFIMPRWMYRFHRVNVCHLREKDAGTPLMEPLPSLSTPLSLFLSPTPLHPPCFQLRVQLAELEST